MSRASVTPEDAVMEYERCAAEVQKLTSVIRNNHCPDYDEGDPFTGDAGQSSCFTRASELANEPPGFYTLDALYASIIKAVEDCSECTELAHAINDRRVARKRLGVAKRRIRAVGKRLIRAKEAK